MAAEHALIDVDAERRRTSAIRMEDTGDDAARTAAEAGEIEMALEDLRIGYGAAHRSAAPFFPAFGLATGTSWPR